MDNLLKMSAERAREAADEFFKLQNLEFAIRSINAAREFDAHTPQVEAYFTAYMVHKLAAAGKTHYEVLAIDESQADKTAIRVHYKRMAILLHPDKNRSVAAEGAFKIVHSAWEVLSDPEKKAAYDRRLKGAASASPSMRKQQTRKPETAKAPRKPETANTPPRKQPPKKPETTNASSGEQQSKRPAPTRKQGQDKPEARPGAKRSGSDFEQQSSPRRARPSSDGFTSAKVKQQPPSVTPERKESDTASTQVVRSPGGISIQASCGNYIQVRRYSSYGCRVETILRTADGSLINLGHSSVLAALPRSPMI